MPNYNGVPIIAIGDLVEWFDDEWSDELTPKQNVQALVKEIKHFRKLTKTMQAFINDVDDWLEEYEEGEFLDAAPQEVTISSSEHPA